VNGHGERKMGLRQEERGAEKGEEGEGAENEPD
jgi:hypothetical protein